MQMINIIYHINKIKDKNQIIIAVNVEKAFDNLEHPFMVKTLNKMGIEEKYLNIVNATYWY